MATINVVTSDDPSKARAAISAVSTADSRLYDNRTPTDGSVTALKLHPTLGSATTIKVGSSTAASPLLSINAAEDEFRSFAFQTEGLNRWIVRTNADAETGSDAGSNFEIVSRTDAGGGKTTVLSVVRSTGAATWTGAFTTTGILTANADSELKGNVTVGESTAFQRYFTVNASAGQYRVLNFQSDGVARWHFRVDNSAESGSDAGSNLQLVARTDAGGSVGTALEVERATMKVTFGGELVAAASATAGAKFRVPHGLTPTTLSDGDVWTTTSGLYVRINGVTVGPLS